MIVGVVKQKGKVEGIRYLVKGNQVLRDFLAEGRKYTISYVEKSYKSSVKESKTEFNTQEHAGTWWWWLMTELACSYTAQWSPSKEGLCFHCR